MASDKLKDFLSRDPYGAAHGSQTLDYLIDDQGDDTADPYMDDLEDDLKETLGNWVSEHTNENRYGPEKGTSGFSLTDDAGNPAVPALATEHSSMFADDVEDADLSSYYNKISGGGTPYSDGGGTFDPDQIASVVIKDGSDPTRSGHTALSAAHDAVLISPVLQRNNRWHPSGNSPYIPAGGNANSTIDKMKYTTYQPELGEYHSGAKAVRLNDMKKVAEKLLISAIGHDPKASDFMQGLLPSWTQLGAKKLTYSAFHTDAVAAGTTAFPAYHESRETFSVARESPDLWHKSYGVMTSHLEPFSAIPKMGMTTLAIAMILALGIFTDIIIMILSIFIVPIPSGQEIMNKTPVWMRGIVPGKNRQGAPALVNPEFFGIRGLSSGIDFKSAASAGAEVFFGEIAINADEGLLASLMPGGKNVMDAPGFYGIIFRAVVRSTIELGAIIGEAFSGGIMAMMSGIMTVFDAIRNSKLIAYMNMLASLGDVYVAVLDQIADGEISVTTNKDHSGGIGVALSRIDALPMHEDPGHRVAKNRRGQGYTYDSEMMWRSAGAPSLYLVPSVVNQYHVALTGDKALLGDLGLSDPHYHADYGQKYIDEKDKGGDGLGKKFAHQVAYTTKSRFSQEAVTFIESLLDGEYVPFYFHDLRTNEIISFHAFLTSLSDSYTANYDSSTGMGRMDAVMIYNNTTRAIGVTFKVVATSAADMSAMWWKINKLTTMVYPQYSSGTPVVSQDGMKHVSPFSQIPSASPLIRMRLGDVFRSNYSKFALSRIFGFEQDAGVLDQPDISIDDIAGALSNIDRVVAGGLVGVLTAPPLFGAPTTEFYAKTMVKMSTEKPAGKDAGWKKKLGSAVTRWFVVFPAGTIFTVKKITPTFESVDKAIRSGDFTAMSSFGIATVEPVTNRVWSMEGPLTTDKGPRGTSTEKSRIASIAAKWKRIGEGPNPREIKIPYFTLCDEARFGSWDVKKHDAVLTKPPGSQKIIDFMAAKDNPITRAFESTAGKGLAGVITQLDLGGWTDVTWETDGMIAPKTMDITISFAPIHDIPPGIDYHGFNRAPIYPVGAAAGAVGGQALKGPEEEETPED